MGVNKQNHYFHSKYNYFSSNGQCFHVVYRSKFNEFDLLFLVIKLIIQQIEQNTACM